MVEKVKLSKLEPGTLFKRGDTYAFKSEYRNEKGVCECFILGSGEMFWGGTGNPNDLKVEPIDFVALMKDVEMLNKIRAEAEDLYAEEIDLSDFGERVLNIIWLNIRTISCRKVKIMSLKEKLSSITQSALEDTALNFSTNVQKTLLVAAEKGESELLVSLKDADLKVVSSQSFLTAVQELLEGVNVEIIEKSTNTLFPSLKAKYIRLSWND